MEMPKWMGTPEAKTNAAAAQDSAWAEQFPNADKSKFVAQVDFDKKHNASAEISKTALLMAERVRLRHKIFEPTQKPR